MTTWNMDTVGKVSRLWMELGIDESFLVSERDDVLAATRSRLVHMLCEEAHTFGVDAHPGDIRFHERPMEPERGFGVIVHAAWHPSTNIVEFVGGEHDGKIVAIERVGEPFRLPRMEPPALADADGAYVSIAVDEYEMAGWRETERRWVYAHAH